MWSCKHKDIGTLYLIAVVWAGIILSRPPNSAKAELYNGIKEIFYQD